MTNQGQDRLTEVLQKISELAQRAAYGDYLYRGEPEHYKRVSSSLYREYSDIEAEYFDVKIVQEEMLQEAKRFIRETNEDVILEQLQHFGYPTNQIDFTTDYNIALFLCLLQRTGNGRKDHSLGQIWPGRLERTKNSGEPASSLRRVYS